MQVHESSGIRIQGEVVLQRRNGFPRTRGEPLKAGGGQNPAQRERAVPVHEYIEVSQPEDGLLQTRIALPVAVAEARGVQRARQFADDAERATHDPSSPRRCQMGPRARIAGVSPRTGLARPSATCTAITPMIIQRARECWTFVNRPCVTMAITNPRHARATSG